MTNKAGITERHRKDEQDRNNKQRIIEDLQFLNLLRKFTGIYFSNFFKTGFPQESSTSAGINTENDGLI